MRKTTAWIRVAVLFLALCMATCVFAACTTAGTNPQASGGEANGTNPPVTTEDLYDANGKLKDTLPEDLNFDRTYKVLAVSGQKSHFYATEEDTDNVKRAVYQRNLTVEDRLGIEIEWDFVAGSANNKEINAFVQKAESDYQSSGEYDSVISYNLVPYILANRGYCVNLADTEYIDLTGPWWPSVFMDRLLYKNQIFALVNSCGYGTLTNMTAIYFNNDLIDAKGIRSPYELVASNEWHAGTLKELIRDTYEDLNADGRQDATDLYGLCTSTNARLTCWYYGFGCRLTEIGADGQLILTANSDRLNTAIDTIVDLFSTKDSLLVDAPSQYTMFMDERAIFYLSTLTISTKMVQNGLEINYGVAPIPKLNAEQDQYYTHVPNTHEAWFILSSAKDVDCSSAFIECMASEAYRQVNDVFFESNLKLRYAPDERLADMYDLVRDSITFDFLYVYKRILTNDCDNYIRKCIDSPASNRWTTTWASIGATVTSDFQKILDTYDLRDAIS